MAQVNGLHTFIERNDVRSVVLFSVFQIAFQLIALTVMIFASLGVPDLPYMPLRDPLGYLLVGVPGAFVVGMAMFGWNAHLFTRRIREATGAVAVTRRDEPRLCGIVEGIAARAGVPTPHVSVLPDRAMNAFASGLTRLDSHVVVTRGLLDTLDDCELEAVVAHEVAHIMRGDVRLMLMANAMSDTVTRIRRRVLENENGQIAGKRWYEWWVAFVFPPLTVLVLFAIVMFWLSVSLANWARLLISSSREFSADAEAVRLTQNPHALISALGKVAGRSTVENLDRELQAMMIDGPAIGAGATHPPLQDRIDALVSLGGSLAAVPAGSRLDTRTSGNDGFGKRTPERRVAPSAAPTRTVSRPNVTIGSAAFARANTDGHDDMAHLRVPAVVLAVVLAVQSSVAFAMGHGLDAFTFEGNGRAATVRSAERDLTRGAPSRAIARETRKLSRSHPNGARCFKTADYDVAQPTMPLPPVSTKAIVGAARATLRDETLPDVSRWERRLGAHMALAHRFAEADFRRSATLGRAYFRQRKRIARQLHEAHGEAGLRLAHRLHGTKTFRRADTRLKVRAHGIARNARERHEISLLASVRGDFVPCLARARRNLKVLDMHNVAVAKKGETGK